MVKMMSLLKCLGTFIFHLSSTFCNSMIPSMGMWHNSLAFWVVSGACAPFVYIWWFPHVCIKRKVQGTVIKIRDTKESRNISIYTFWGTDTTPKINMLMHSSTDPFVYRLQIPVICLQSWRLAGKKSTHQPWIEFQR